MIGRTLGPYRVLAKLGEGGMGEVYRAWDSRLKREVALKVVAQRFALDPIRLSRFEREAHVLASLNHPNIAIVYAIEEVAGTQALVMELVQGTTLQDRLADSADRPAAVPLREALMIAQQIAAALEAAHDHGVVHRDLKPANIILRPDGAVKVLDFGLALARRHADDARADAVVSTITLTATSGPGEIVGTPAYMSPEQARGLDVDKRTDMWAFGCVLYEMLSGERPFPGERASDVFAKILERPPDFDALPAHTPATVRRLLRRCLEKDPGERMRSAGDAALEIRDALLAPAHPRVDAAPESRSVRWWSRTREATVSAVALVAVVAATAGAALTVWVRGGTVSEDPSLPVRTQLVLPQLAGIDIAEGDRLLAITPDGSAVVFAGNHGQQLFVRPLDRLTPTALTAPSMGVRAPFVSPDNQWVGYVEGNFTLKRVPISGGPTITIATLDGPSRGASWVSPDTIIVATHNNETGLQLIPVDGRSATVLTRPNASDNELDHVYPDVLPGGRAALMTILPVSRRMEDARIAVVDLETGRWESVLRGGYNARYLRGGYLVYAAGTELHIVEFDLERRETIGAPRPVVADLTSVAIAIGAAHFDISGDGTLVYLRAARAAAGRTPVWVDRNTQLEMPLPGFTAGAYAVPRLSPDNTKLAIYKRDGERDLWIRDLSRDREERLTIGPDVDSWAAWVSDDQLAFGSMRSHGMGNVFLQSAHGTGTARQLTTGRGSQVPVSVLPGGSTLIVSASPDATVTGGWDLRLLPLSAAPEPRITSGTDDIAALNSRFNERNGIVSPDRRFIALDSDRVGGRFEVFVRSYPDVTERSWQISGDGGHQPLWSADGDELFYLSLDGAMMAVQVDRRGSNFSAPTELFRGDYVISGAGNIVRHYDVARDGRFLMLKNVATSPEVADEIIVVQNWADEMQRVMTRPDRP